MKKVRKKKASQFKFSEFRINFCEILSSSTSNFSFRCLIQLNTAIKLIQLHSTIQLHLIDDSNNHNLEWLKREQRELYSWYLTHLDELFATILV